MWLVETMQNEIKLARITLIINQQMHLHKITH